MGRECARIGRVHPLRTWSERTATEARRRSLALAAFGALVALGVLSSSARAQEASAPAIARSTWTTEEGLPQNSVSGLALDETGYLWVSTFGGLARFDGHRFEVLDVSTRSDLAVVPHQAPKPCKVVY